MWIQESMKRSRRLKDEYKVNSTNVFIKDRLPETVSAEFVFSYVSSRIPSYMTRNVDVIYVGQFPEMKKRDINAYFDNDAIYVTNEQEDEMDMIEDIIHEISHAVEHYNREFLYDDGALQREFIGKRKRLSSLLSQEYEVPVDFNINFEYDRAIDDFLYRDVGYDALNQICVNIFPSGYASTSLSEYWAKGFEELFIGNRDDLKSMCPILYNRLIGLMKELEENT